MAGKKRPPTALAELDADSSQDEEVKPAKAFPAEQMPAKKKKKLAMELKKQRKQLDKDRHRQSADNPKPKPQPAAAEEPAAAAAAAVVPAPAPAPVAVVPVPAPAPVAAVAAGPGLRMNVFKDLASPEASLREAAAEALVAELREVQSAYEKSTQEGEEEADGPSQMEAEKDDGLDNCAPAVRYAIRRLIRGISSSREVSSSLSRGRTLYIVQCHIAMCCCFTLQLIV
jgi:DNA polymerase phi